MQFNRSAIGIVILFLTWVAASFADMPKVVVSSDDCFSSFSGDAKKCDLGLCLSRIAVGEEDKIASLKFNACQKGGGDRLIASVNDLALGGDQLGEGDELPAPRNSPFTK